MNTAIIGMVMLAISIGGAALLAGGRKSSRPRQAKILLFGLYFWILTFVQLIIAALAYALLKA